MGGAHEGLQRRATTNRVRTRGQLVNDQSALDEAIPLVLLPSAHRWRERARVGAGDTHKLVVEILAVGLRCSLVDVQS